PEPKNHVSSQLFGQMFERDRTEPGYDAARIPGTGRMDPRVIQILQNWRVPVIRWPGGRVVRSTDWRDMIDHAPGRDGPRPPFSAGSREPQTHEIGVDEFLRLCQELGAEPLLPVNFRFGLERIMPLEEAARLAAGLVAYCNAPLGARLPDGMPDWPGVRARNGHPEPYGVRYFQICNEVWIYLARSLEQIGLGLGEATDEERAAWYLKCWNTYVDAMKAVDPHIEIFTEWEHTDPAPEWAETNRLIATDPSMRKADWFVRHRYVPWTIERIQRDGVEVSAREVPAEDLWYTWVAAPQTNPLTGQSEFGWQEARQEGRRMAVTEWNWNGWWGMAKEDRPDFDDEMAKGLGAAGFLHALIRMGDTIHLACQSIAMGIRWANLGMQLDPTGENDPVPTPRGDVTGFYSRLHGNVRLEAKLSGVPFYRQPYEMGWLEPQEKVAMLDVVATRSPDSLFIHLINRDCDRDHDAEIDLTQLPVFPGRATLHTMTRAPARKNQPVHQFANTPLVFSDNKLSVTLPRQSVSILEIPSGETSQP
ncbi:MAG: hypothetical protein SNJ84_09220, partial [Verrucomicrobiia bacterium]